MHPKTLIAIVATACLTVSAPSIFAKGGGGGKPKHSAKKEIPEHHVTIGSISADSITVNGMEKEPKTFSITKDTEITYKGQKAKVEDLKAGMRVTVTPGTDLKVAGRIAASEAPTPKATK